MTICVLCKKQVRTVDERRLLYPQMRRWHYDDMKQRRKRLAEFKVRLRAAHSPAAPPRKE